MKSIKFAILNIKKNIKNEQELKSAFLMSIIGMAINNIAFLFIWYYFGKTIGKINGWVPMDIFGLYGFTGIAIGLIDALFAGLHKIPEYITTGNFDKYLLTPKNILLKVITSKISTSAIGDLFFGVICFTIFYIHSKLSLIHLLISIILMIIASTIYFSFSLVCMTISFYLMDGSNISAGLHGMLLSNSLYHGGAFTGILRFTFIFVIPSLLIGVIPVEIIKTLDIRTIIMISILTIFWVISSITFFYKSLRKYESNNFFGFGS